MSVSGAALHAPPGQPPFSDARDIMEALDRGLTDSVTTPTGAIVMISPGPPSTAVRSSSTTHDLQEALKRNELRLYYQPVMSLDAGGRDAGGIVGLEALLRWEHAERGLLASKDFLGDAESAGLMIPIGRWVLREVCRQMRDWRKSLGPERVPPVHVNVSSSEFWDPGLPPYLARLLSQTGVPAAGLRLEVTESTLSRDPVGAANVLHGLGALGVDVWLEDFGGGALPLAALSALPFKHLKVDRALTWQLEEGSRHAGPLLGGLIDLARHLGREPVAGGVETSQDVDFLRETSCRLGQGYYFSDPVDAGAMSLLLSDSA
jgi:EAL domain-containing protein (putative c-di-GMP-specific phosphodiesterase class I)